MLDEFLLHTHECVVSWLGALLDSKKPVGRSSDIAHNERTLGFDDNQCIICTISMVWLGKPEAAKAHLLCESSSRLALRRRSRTITIIPQYLEIVFRAESCVSLRLIRYPVIGRHSRIMILLKSAGRRRWLDASANVTWTMTPDSVRCSQPSTSCFVPYDRPLLDESLQRNASTEKKTSTH